MEAFCCFKKIFKCFSAMYPVHDKPEPENGFRLADCCSCFSSLYIGIWWSHFGTHGHPLHLQVVLTIELKVVSFKNKCELFNQNLCWGIFNIHVYPTSSHAWIQFSYWYICVESKQDEFQVEVDPLHLAFS